MILRVTVLDRAIALAEFLKQAGRALDVCEQERNRSSGEIGHPSFPFRSR
jgi:hypothetical protein